MFVRICHIVLVAALIATTGRAQSQAPAVRATTAGVLIDVTVLDGRGRLVLDLIPADFELSEDGRTQQLVSVALVTGGIARPLGIPSPGPAAPAPAPAPAPSEEAPSTPEKIPTVTAIVFDKLSPDAMPYAGRAALASISTLDDTHEYAGVFLVDVNLRSFQPFTSDRQRLRDSIERVASTATANFRREKGRAGDLYIQKLDPDTPPTAGADSPGGFATVAERQRWLASLHPADRKLAAMAWRMELAYRQIADEYEGQTSIAALRAVVDALGEVPGRKSILYFTENVIITDRLRPGFEAIIGRANRANITFYPVDAAGLRLHSKEMEVSRNVNLAGAQGIGDAPREDGAWTKELERQNQLLVSRPAAVLGRLAKETGGFVIENTNNLAAGVARMQQERTTYYLLGYQSTNSSLDGKFRRVTVKVKRRDVSLRARPGYLAVAQEQR